MEPHGQDGPYLRLKQESHKIRIELAGVLASLREIRLRLQANAEALSKDPSVWNIDTDILAGEVKQAGRDADRYRELLTQQADNSAAIARFECA